MFKIMIKTVLGLELVLGPIYTIRLWYTIVRSNVSDQLTAVLRKYC